MITLIKRYFYKVVEQVQQVFGTYIVPKDRKKVGKVLDIKPIDEKNKDIVVYTLWDVSTIVLNKFMCCV